LLVVVGLVAHVDGRHPRGVEGQHDARGLEASEAGRLASAVEISELEPVAS